MGETTNLRDLNLSFPTPLTNSHSLDDFDCGNSDLNNWLKRYAILNQQANSAKTFVVCNEIRVIGFYALSVGSIEHGIASKRIKAGLAGHPIPVMILARLAVDLKFQGYRIGRNLLKDAICRTIKAADIAGIRAIFVHAKDEKVCKFYKRFDFEPSPVDPMKLMLLTKDARKIATGQ